MFLKVALAHPAGTRGHSSGSSELSVSEFFGGERNRAFNLDFEVMKERLVDV